MLRRSALAALALLTAFAAPAPAAAEDPPLDCAEALSTQDMNNCAGAEYEKADAALNAVFKQALAAIPDMAGEKPFDAKSWEEALRASQRAWIAYRDQECDEHVAMFWSGGSGGTVEIIGCKTALTEARTKDLKTRYEIE